VQLKPVVDKTLEAAKPVVGKTKDFVTHTAETVMKKVGHARIVVVSGGDHRSSSSWLDALDPLPSCCKRVTLNKRTPAVIQGSGQPWGASLWDSRAALASQLLPRPSKPHPHAHSLTVGD
jgi:hypothetical protein